MKIYGLIGHPLSHSFSARFFNEKFEKEEIDARYLNFDLEEITQFPDLLIRYPDLEGMNVTIPYKEAIIPYLDELDEKAAKIGAVNVIRVIRKEGRTILKGYNSDWVGFRDALQPLLTKNHRKALVLGTGGASKAVVMALHEMGLTTQYVSRTGSETNLTYEEITADRLQGYDVVVNTTPVGMYPHIEEAPPLPYEKGVNSAHIFFDLIYNPEETRFMKLAAAQGASVKNGYEMLIGQALEAWRIWND